MKPLNATQAAELLGISVKTLYKWKRESQSNQGVLVLNRMTVRFRFRQTGIQGNGRILFEREWLEDLMQAMEGRKKDRRPTRRQQRSRITARLGLPPG